MNKKLITLLFLSFGICAFQDNFESVIKKSYESSVSEKVVAGKPFGYCLLDGLAMEYCKSVSIDLSGKTFRKYTFLNNPPEVITSQAQVQLLKDNYFLGVDDFEYDVPTTGQLTFLLENEVIPTDPGCHWVKKEIGDGYAKAGHEVDYCAGDAKLRLVTKEIPSVCDSSTDCGLGVINRSVTLIVRNYTGPIKLELKYTNKLTSEEVAELFEFDETSTKWTANTYMPYFVDLVRVQVWLYWENLLDVSVDGLGWFEAGGAFYPLERQECFTFIATGKPVDVVTFYNYEVYHDRDCLL